MYDFLVDHALKNVWCTPDQDTQLIIKPARLTANGGVSHYLTVATRRTLLPDSKSDWHVYQIGQVHPLLLGLLPPLEGVWQNFTGAMNTQKMICDIYVNSGIQIPRFETWYMYNKDRDLIMAVKKNPLVDYDFNEAIFLRVYTNAYFSSFRSDALQDIVFTSGNRSRTPAEFLEFQSLYQQYKAKPGLVYAFVNGYKVSDIDMITAKLGDICEFVFDSSIKKVVNFQIANLQVFNSTLDHKRKYLLHYAGADDSTIDFRDDIDIFILDPLTNGRHRGLYYHKNAADSLQMVTHRDYSVPTPYALGYFDKLNTASLAVDSVRIPMFDNLTIRLHIRKSGYDRPLVLEANRIADLYKLNEAELLRAMVGIDSVVPNWRAEVLEASDYVKVMNANCCDITNELVQSAYGYNLISKIIGDTPSVPYDFSQRKVVDVPYGLQAGMTAYEYDAQGHLLEYHQQYVGSLYVCNNPSTKLVELISGLGSRTVSDRLSVDNIAVDPTQGYKVYYNPSKSIGTAAGWIDVTDTDKYLIVNGYVKRTDASTDGQFMVRDEKRFLAYDLSLSMSRGELRFGLTQVSNVNGGVISTAMYVPMGEIDLFLNNKSLIRDLDYFVRFPEVCIVNKEFLDDPLNKLQKVHIRFTGFCDESIQLSKANDVGFVKQGTLSRNNKYDLRDDRVIRIVMGGSLRIKDDLVFSETTTQVSILNAENGRPYAVQDTIVPLKYISTKPDFTLKKKSVVIDKAVSDYLTIKLPQGVITEPSAITARYVLFSPFVCSILYALNSGVIAEASIINLNRSEDISAIVQPYVKLLTFDPTQQSQPIDSNFVIVHPHNLDTVIEVTLPTYLFLEKIVKLYTGNTVILSPFLRLKAI